MRLSNVLLNMCVCVCVCKRERHVLECEWMCVHVWERERERGNRNEFRNEKTFPSTQSHIIQRHFLPHQLLMSHINQFSNSQFCSFFLSLFLAKKHIYNHNHTQTHTHSLSFFLAYADRHTVTHIHTLPLSRLHRQTQNIYQCFCLTFFLTWMLSYLFVYSPHIQLNTNKDET